MGEQAANVRPSDPKLARVRHANATNAVGWPVLKSWARLFSLTLVDLSRQETAPLGQQNRACVFVWSFELPGLTVLDLP